MIINETYYPAFKNHELILDLNLNAFSIYDVSGWRDDQMPGLVDYLIYPEYSKESRTEAVTDNSGVIVTDSAGLVVTVEIDTIEINKFEPREEIVTFLYLSQQVNFDAQTYWGFSRYLNRSFRDWDNILQSHDATGWWGFGFESYLLTGYNLSGDMARQGQSIYLQTFCERTEFACEANNDGSYYYYGPSACWVSSQWDWNNSAAQGKWGTSFNTYRFTKPLPTLIGAFGSGITTPFDYGETVITTKNKLRGRGKALSILFEAEYLKDLKLLGWNTLNTKNGEP